MKLNELEHKKILLVGYGVEGRATHEFLSAFVPSSSVTVVDKKDGPHYLDGQDQFDLAIKSPGVPRAYIRIPYTTATNIFFANTKGTVIGVTGTKGKSTTSSLLYAIFKEARFPVHLIGNIGTPMLRELVEEKGAEDLYVCELSSYQLDDIQFSPHVALILNVFPEHMDYHGTAENYWKAKRRIVAFSHDTDYLVYNPAFSQLVHLSKHTKAQAVPFVDTIPMADQDIPLVGQHNRDNIRAALTVGTLFDIPPHTMTEAIKNFQPLPHRLECVGTYRDITFYDDAISTTPQSTIAAIKALKHVGTILLGGKDRGYDFSELVKVVSNYAIGTVILFPDTGKILFPLLKKVRHVPSHIIQTDTMEEAVQRCYQYTPLHTICLLSTASPSFSLWKNFEEKGDLFQHFVKLYAFH